MVLRDLSDSSQPVLQRYDNIRRTNSRTRAQSTSVDRGSFRVKSAEGMEVGTAEDPTGSGTVYGIWRILGELLLQGDMNVTGGGKITVGGVVIEPLGGGRIKIGPNIVLDAATQTITVGTGSAKIVLDASARTISVGTGVRIVTSSDGNARIEIGSGDDIVSFDSSYGSPRMNLGMAQIESATGESITFTMGTNVVYFVDGTVRVPAIDAPPSGATGLRYVVADALGNFYVASGAGGGGGDTPPNPYPEGYVWPADPGIYGISDNYAAHVARGSAEPGTDVMTPVGAAVYAPADGEIRAVNTSPTGATGRLIVFRASNGAWFRMLHLSQVLVTSGPVTQGTLIGRSGGSGFGSESYYGPHLHITYLPGPSDTQPPLSSSTDFEVVMAAQG